MSQEDERRTAVPWLTLLVLVGVGVWMIYLTLHEVRSLSVWELHDPDRIRPWLAEVALRYGVHVVALFSLGVVIPLVVRHRRPASPAPSAKPAKRSGGVFASLGKMCVSWLRHGVFASVVLGVAALLSCWVFGQLALATGLLFACDVALGLFALTVGLAIGIVWRRSRRSLVKQALMVTLFLAVAGGWLYRQAIQREPLGFQMPTITVADRERIMEVVRRESVVQEDQRVFHLAMDDLNKLAGWWVTAKSADIKARVINEPESDDQRFEVSVPFPLHNTPKTYLNMRVAGQCAIDLEELDIRLTHLQVGRLAAPRSVTRWLGRFIQYWIVSDRDNLDLLTGIVQAGIEGDDVKVTVTENGIRERRFARLLRRLQNHPDVTDAVRAHLQAFARISKDAQPSDPLFAKVVQDAFQRAAAATRRGDAVEANRAAILSLGVALGHHKLERVVGDCLDDDALQNVTRIPLRSKLRQRADWSRHFWVSAALTLLIDAEVSDAAGLFKEELDAIDGGSGFSFGDLMADRAGTVFARTATRDEPSAAAIQAWVLAHDRDLNELMPDASDLPEGLTDQQLTEQYGGVRGEQYQKLVENMDKRLSGLSWCQ